MDFEMLWNLSANAAHTCKSYSSKSYWHKLQLGDDQELIPDALRELHAEINHHFKVIFNKMSVHWHNDSSEPFIKQFPADGTTAILTVFEKQFTV